MIFVSYTTTYSTRLKGYELLKQITVCLLKPLAIIKVAALFANQLLKLPCDFQLINLLN